MHIEMEDNFICEFCKKYKCKRKRDMKKHIEKINFCGDPDLDQDERIKLYEKSITMRKLIKCEFCNLVFTSERTYTLKHVKQCEKDFNRRIAQETLETQKELLKSHKELLKLQKEDIDENKRKEIKKVLDETVKITKKKSSVKSRKNVSKTTSFLQRSEPRRSFMENTPFRAPIPKQKRIKDSKIKAFESEENIDNEEELKNIDIKSKDKEIKKPNKILILKQKKRINSEIIPKEDILDSKNESDENQEIEEDQEELFNKSDKESEEQDEEQNNEINDNEIDEELDKTNKDDEFKEELYIKPKKETKIYGNVSIIRERVKKIEEEQEKSIIKDSKIKIDSKISKQKNIKEESKKSNNKLEEKNEPEESEFPMPSLEELLKREHTSNLAPFDYSTFNVEDFKFPKGDESKEPSKSLDDTWFEVKNFYRMRQILFELYDVDKTFLIKLFREHCLETDSFTKDWCLPLRKSSDSKCYSISVEPLRKPSERTYELYWTDKKKEEVAFKLMTNITRYYGYWYDYFTSNGTKQPFSKISKEEKDSELNKEYGKILRKKKYYYHCIFSHDKEKYSKEIELFVKVLDRFL